MFFDLGRFFCSCLIFFISAQISAKPFFFEDYELKDDGNRQVKIFKENVQLKLRFCFLSETFTIVIPSNGVSKNGSSENKEVCIPISPHHKSKITVIYGDDMYQVAEVSNDGDTLLIKNSEEHIYRVNLNNYISRPVRYSFEAKIEAGEYGHIHLIDSFLNNSTSHLCDGDPLDGSREKIHDVARVWWSFCKKYIANCLEQNFKTFIKEKIIGIVSSNMSSKDYSELYRFYYEESSATSTAYESLRKAQELTNNLIDQMKKIKDDEDRAEALCCLLGTSFWSFYSESFNETLWDLSRLDGWREERQKLPNAVVDKTIISQDELNEKIKERRDGGDILSEDGEVEKIILQEAAKEIDLRHERPKVVAIKHIYAHDKELKKALTQAVDSLHLWFEGQAKSGSEMMTSDIDKMTIFDIIKQNSAVDEVSELFVGYPVLSFIEIFAGKIFIEKVLKPALDGDQALVKWMNNPQEYKDLAEAMFINRNHDEFVEKINAYVLQCIEDKELNGSQEAYSVKSTIKLGVEPSEGSGQLHQPEGMNEASL